MAFRDRLKRNAYMQGYLNARYLQRVTLAREMLGGKCVRCGTEENLEFDHIDPSTKSALVTDLTHVTVERFRVEVAKCQLLCSECHREKHRAVHPCGDARRYWQGCRCAECRAANTRHCKQTRRAA